LTIIDNISGNTEEFQRIDRDKDLKRTKSSKNLKPDKVSSVSTGNTREIKKDIVDISPLGKSLLQQKSAVSHYRQEIESIKTLSQDALLKIHQKIESNFYDKPEVLTQIVDNIVSQGPAEPQKTSVPEEKPDHLSDIRSKIANGEYNSEEVLDVIVEKLLNPSEFR
jgi:hypothetical protein